MDIRNSGCICEPSCVTKIQGHEFHVRLFFIGLLCCGNSFREDSKLIHDLKCNKSGIKI
jgi:hypothetical protein